MNWTATLFVQIRISCRSRCDAWTSEFGFGKLREGFQNCMAYLHPAVIVYCIVIYALVVLVAVTVVLGKEAEAQDDGDINLAL